MGGTLVTKDKLLYMVAHWADKTTGELAEYCGCSEATIEHWARAMRKRGVDLPTHKNNDNVYNVAARELKMMEEMAKRRERAAKKEEIVIAT